MKTTSYKVSDTLYLIHQSASKAPTAKPVEVPTNHIAVIDCSGSMSGDLPKIREQLKKKLPKMLREKDTISIIWFSSRGEFGTLLEAEPVATLKDLKEVETAIDRWLRPVGMTGFREPLEEVAKLAARVTKKNPGSAHSLFFMSDGCDNQSYNRADIMKAVEQAGAAVSSSTFVEYGYYADRQLLTSMAEKAGGALIFAQDFDQYAPSFEAALQKRGSGAPRVEVKIQGDPVAGFAWAVDGTDLVTYGVEDGKIHVPESTTGVWYVAPSSVGTVETLQDTGPSYAALALYAGRMKSDIVLSLLRFNGDVAFIDQFSGLFGKQKYSEFQEAAKAAAFDGSKRLTKGCDPKRVPRDDAFTTIDFLRILSKDDGNRLLLDHPLFKYSRIGRGRVDSGEALTSDEMDEIAKLTQQLSGEKNVKKVQEINTRIAAITASKQPALKFEAEASPDGYSISNLTFNEDRPNISVLVRKTGTVDLSPRLPDSLRGNTIGKPPEKFPSFIFRNYTVVKDGLTNVSALPVKLSDATRSYLAQLVQDGDVPEAAVSLGKDADVVYLDRLPIINRKMVKEVSAKALFEKEYALTKARAAQKVYNTYRKDLFPKKSEGFEAIYGKEASDWLKEQGVTDYSGFNPKSVQAESTDFYMGKELTVSLKGLSSLPSLKDVKAAIVKGKLNAGAALMAPYVKEVEDFLVSPAYTGSPKKDQLLEAWIEGQQKTATNTVRGLLFEMAQIKFSVIVGQVWFKEFKSLDENTLTIDVDGQNIEGKVEAKEVQVMI